MGNRNATLSSARTPDEMIQYCSGKVYTGQNCPNKGICSSITTTINAPKTVGTPIQYGSYIQFQMVNGGQFSNKYLGFCNGVTFQTCPLEDINWQIINPTDPNSIAVINYSDQLLLKNSNGMGFLINTNNQLNLNNFATCTADTCYWKFTTIPFQTGIVKYGDTILISSVVQSVDNQNYINNRDGVGFALYTVAQPFYIQSGIDVVADTCQKWYSDPANSEAVQQFIKGWIQQQPTADDIKCYQNDKDVQAFEEEMKRLGLTNLLSGDQACYNQYCQDNVGQLIGADVKKILTTCPNNDIQICQSIVNIQNQGKEVNIGSISPVIDCSNVNGGGGGGGGNNGNNGNGPTPPPKSIGWVKYVLISLGGLLFLTIIALIIILIL